MQSILVIGAGTIGGAIADFLGHTGDYRITLSDARAESLNGAGSAAVTPLVLDAADEAALSKAAQDHDAVVNAGPFWANERVMKAAAAAGVHYFDITEDVASTRTAKRLAENATGVVAPQCGLAPGFVSIAAHHLTKKFDSLRDVRLRVGALPQYPVNRLGYNLTWSPESLIHEYCAPCEAIVGGARVEIAPLEGVERVFLDGVEYEAFNTSGGLGTLCDTLDGRVDNLTYRSLRYPGHREVMKALLDDLRLCDRQDLLREIFENAVPRTGQDVIVIFITVNGEKDGRLMEETFTRKIYGREVAGRDCSAIQVVTAAGVCAVLDMVRAGALPDRGFLRQEEIELEDFLANRFGRLFLAESGSPVPLENRKVA